jgi:Fe-S oxidoreductase
MATLKSEFRAHHYEKRLRPRFMYALGWVHEWSRIASLVAPLANFVSHAPGISTVFKFLGGVTQSRHVPAFAPFTFKQWFKSHKSPNPSAAPVVLYPDTFNNYFHPETAIAAVEVLEDAGFHVVVPEEDVCCGRPLYDYGFLNMAKRRLQDNIQKLRPYLQADIPIVVLEPSCWAVFIDELPNMLPNSKDGGRLTKNVHLLAHFLHEKAPGYKIPKLKRKALLHRHCHQKSELHHKKDYEGEILKEMQLEVNEPETGCCGMAGAFGYEPGDHYDVSIKCGERVLLPQARDAGDQDLIVADGFSCREQIAQETSRLALHLAQVLQIAKHHGETGLAGRPEAELVSTRRCLQLQSSLMVGAGLLAGLAVGYLAYRDRSRR